MLKNKKLKRSHYLITSVDNNEYVDLENRDDEGEEWGGVFRPSTPDNQILKGADALNNSITRIYGSPQKYQKGNDLILAFVNRHDSVKQLINIWRRNMSRESCSDASLIVLEQAFGM